MKRYFSLLFVAMIYVFVLSFTAYAQAAYTFWASEDAWVNKNNAETNYGKNTYLSVKDRSGISEAYVKFNQADIDLLSSLQIANASFFLYQYQGTVSSEDSINLHRISSDWSEASVSWANRPEYDLEIISYLNITDANSPGWRQWAGLENEVSLWPQGWCFGLALENHLDKQNEELFTRFYSSEYRDSLLRPHLDVTTAATTPEPATSILFALGTGLLAVYKKKSKIRGKRSFCFPKFSIDRQ